MKMKNLSFSILMISTICLLISCFHSSEKISNPSDFYSRKAGWDAARIPFLKPYEAFKASKEMGWFMNLDGVDGDSGFQNIKKANVMDSIIFVYSVNSILHGVDIKESWHVIIPSKHIEKGFSDHQAYLDFLNKLDIQKEPRLYDIDEIAHYFENHETIDWSALSTER